MEKNKKKINFMIYRIIIEVIFLISCITGIIYGYIFLDSPLIMYLGIFIPIIQLFIWKYCKGKLDKNFIRFILIMDIIIAIIESLILIPILILIKTKLEVNFKVINNLFMNRKITLRMIEDIFNLVICILSGIFINKLLIDRNKLLNIDNIIFRNVNKEKIEFKEKSIEVIKPYFEKNNALDEDNCKKIEDLKLNIKYNDNIRNYWKCLKNYKIIIKKDSKYYYDKKNESNIKEKYTIIHKIILTIIITGVIIFINSFIFNLNINQKYEIKKNNNIEYKIETSWNLKKYIPEKGMWEYFKYINRSQDNKIPEQIVISYDNLISNNDSIVKIKETLEIYLRTFLKDEDFKINSYRTSRGYDVIEIIFNEKQGKQICSYIYNKGKMINVSASTNSNDENIIKELNTEVRKIIESIKWK